MKPISFIDVEVEPKSQKILDYGGINSDGNILHTPSGKEFLDFIRVSEFLCGHNIINHDLKYIRQNNGANLSSFKAIDTLYLSPLLFPKEPYHHLVKDDKLQTEELNNPLNDAKKAKDLFLDELQAFQHLDGSLKNIFYSLLGNLDEFKYFFIFADYASENINPGKLIREKFHEEICEKADIDTIISKNPAELAYCLALIYCKNRYSITPPWVLKNYPAVEKVMFLLRNKPCLEGCEYCNKSLDIFRGLKLHFGFETFRNYAGEPLQEKAVKAAIDYKSILAVFPTGGGKSITFQLPALMCGENIKGLTVIISPLQSLMKDQVDNLEKIGITEAVTINGLLDPIERAKSFKRVEEGLASILYISPESLRSKTIERLLLGRKIVRFVIDEAHCFSSWGQDFRVDYLYIGDFIKMVREKKNLEDGIPVSCFTATAKQKVIQDIREYFLKKLNIDLEIFRSKVSRTNLHYEVFEKGTEEEKYNSLRDLIEQKNCPTIIYVSRTGKARLLAQRLIRDGFEARPYHGKMDAKEKTENQNSFISGETRIIVATSAFGMGVDKKDVGLVIHYEISDSLENYVQEAGRAGRDESITADCYVLFNEEDLSKHFTLLNQVKLNLKEIQQVWKAVKELTEKRSSVSFSALEIARKAGWDENIREIETRITTAIAALENSEYLKRGQNSPIVYANSILSKNAQEAIDKINNSHKFNEKQKITATRIIKKLIASKSRKESVDEVAESRVDYISDHLGIATSEVMKIVNLLKEEKILADTKDLAAFIKKGENVNRSLNIVTTFCHLENFLLPIFGEIEKVYHLKEINELAEEKNLDVNPNKIKTIINFWAIKNWIKRHNETSSKNHVKIVRVQPHVILADTLKKRHELAKFIVEYLYRKSLLQQGHKEEILVDFSIHEIKEAYEKSPSLFKANIILDDIEDTLFFLSRIEAIKIEGGFLVIHNKLRINRLEQDNNKRYKIKDYEKLNQFYENKIQQIHIVGEYAKKMLQDYNAALQFVEDYFQLNYTSFLNKYFPGSRQNEIKQNITPAKFKELFGTLSPSQLAIIKDSKSNYIAVAAGPGSGKTRILVHKLASLLLMEDVKHEQLLMLTFSRAAATEFKKRLLSLIGNAANFVEIKTFHSYCFDLLGKVGSIEKSDEIIKTTIQKIKNREVEQNRVSKSVLVIDEAQDINEEEYKLIETLMEINEEMRVIVVGDDDQNIYEFRGSSSKYFEMFITGRKAVKYELIDNYRSKKNLVEFTNTFVKRINHRIKTTPINAIQRDNGELKIIHYLSGNLISPLVKNVLSTGLSGTTCILTKTNDEALKITGLLIKNGQPAKLVQANDGFNLFNLAEVRYFIDQLNLFEDTYVFDDELWNQAKSNLVNKYQNSTKLDICINLIKDFEITNPKKKYKSDLEVFFRESKLEDCYNGENDTIIVSTMHKSKGKEYDNIFILLENFNCLTDPAKRQLYVAMTRAKKNLAIHVNDNYLNNISADDLEYVSIDGNFNPPHQVVMHLTFKDVWLDYFIHKQHFISKLNCGDTLQFNGGECFDSQGNSVLKFSKNFMHTIESFKEGYELKEVKINFIIHWKKEELEEEVKIILPELYFSKG